MAFPQPFAVPEGFSESLRLQFDGRYRVRWSHRMGQWHIEQKVNRTRLSKQRVDLLSDQAIRWQDGYEFLLAVTPGDRTGCPQCFATVKVPVLQMQYAKCQDCGKEFRACYWPLGDALLQHLRYIDPDRDGSRRVLRDIEEAEFAKEFWDNRRAKGTRRDIVLDERKQLFDIQQVGYTGREFH